MGTAREVADQVTSAILKEDFDTAAGLYAPDAVLVDPLAGEVTGDAIIEVFKGFFSVFSDISYERTGAHEAGDVAIDEGFIIGTNTGPLPLPSGESLPATGKQIRLRSCDVMTVKNGKAVDHRFYYDQLEMLSQLGLAPESTSV